VQSSKRREPLLCLLSKPSRKGEDLLLFLLILAEYEEDGKPTLGHTKPAPLNEPPTVGCTMFSLSTPHAFFRLGQKINESNKIHLMGTHPKVIFKPIYIYACRLMPISFSLHHHILFESSREKGLLRIVIGLRGRPIDLDDH